MAATIDIIVPDLGDFDEVEVIELLVAVGDSVAREDGLITVETDKAAMDVPAVVAGTIESVMVNVGDTVSEGSSLAIIDAVAAQNLRKLRLDTPRARRDSPSVRRFAPLRSVMMGFPPIS